MTRTHAQNALRLDYIDALRGVAILGVLVTHCGRAVDVLPAPVRSITDFGAIGVQLFFMLSALTLFQVYSRREFALADFYLRRFFRIAPAFYFAALVYLSARLVGGESVHSIQRYVLSVFFLHNWVPETVRSAVPGGWSIGVEATFYAAFPFFFRYLTSLTRTLPVLAASLGVSWVWVMLVTRWIGEHYDPAQLGDFLYFGFLWNLPVFLLGIALFQLENRKSFVSEIERFFERKVVSWSAWGLVLLFLSLAALGERPFSRRIVAITLLSAVVYLARVTRTRLIVNSWMIHLGKVSYSVYLLHFLVLHLLGLLLFGRVPALGETEGLTQFAILLICALPISWYAASLSWRLVEQPGIAWGRRVAHLVEVRAVNQEAS